MVTKYIEGGKKLEQRLRKIAQSLGGSGKLQVGFFEDAEYPDSGMPVAAVAAIHNYGAPRAKIPPRPFFTNMVVRRRQGWPAALAADLKATDYDGAASLRMMGELIAGQLRQQIQETSSPKLKPATIRRKGFDKPLIDTAHMYDSVTYHVDMGVDVK